LAVDDATAVERPVGPADRGDMVRSRLALLAVLLLSLAVPAYAEPGRQRLAVADLAPGVTHEVWASGPSTARVHVARVDGSALRVVQAPRGRRETASSFCRRTPGCAVAINGDFFTAGGPVGGVISDGRLLRSPSPSHEQLSLEPLRATSGLDWNGVLRAPDGAELTIDGLNVPLVGEVAAVYTSSYGGATPACTCREVVLTEVDGPVGRLGVPTTVVRTGQGAGGTPLGERTVVVAVAGVAADRLQAVVSSGGDLTVTLSVPEPVEQSVGVHPVLLREGQVAPVDRADPMLRDRHPRSVVAWDGQGTVWLAAFEGRQAGGPGPTAEELVAFLQGLGATDAVMLDGGGSTSLATADGPLNRPSDGAERPVSNALVVMSSAVAALRVAAPAPVAAPPVVGPAAPPSAPVVIAPKAPVVAPPPAVVPVPAEVVVAAPPARAVLSPTALDPRTTRVLPAVVQPTGAVTVAAALAALATLAWAAWAWLALSRPARFVDPQKI
jgi:hypothetical protein